MNTSDWIAAVSAAAAVAGVVIAIVQSLSARKERLQTNTQQQQVELLLESVIGQIQTAADSVDMLVQRSKASAPPQEIQNMARLARANLVALAKQLRFQTARADQWRLGSTVRSGRH